MKRNVWGIWGIIGIFFLFFAPLGNAEEKTLVLVGSNPADTVWVKQANSVVAEALRQIGYSYRYEDHPAKRCVHYATTGERDGELGRSFDYNKDYPMLVRVEEPHSTVDWNVYAVNPEITQVSDWAELKSKGYRIGYRRGIKTVENHISDIPADRLTAMTEKAQGLKMLLDKRFDVYADSSIMMDDLLQSDEFKDKGIWKVGTMQSDLVYTFVHEKHKNMAPALSEAIKAVKAKK